MRLTLDWFSRQPSSDYPLSFQPGGRWFSEALFPSQFFARQRADNLAEGWTHADGVIGHVGVGCSALADTKVLETATQLVVTEAKLFSPLSARVTNAAYFDQTARNVACTAELLARSRRQPDQVAALAFFVIAPSEQIMAGVFEMEMADTSIRQKVSRRVAEYCDPAKDRWLREWFVPTLNRIRLDCLSWEAVLDYIGTVDPSFRKELASFYALCVSFNRPLETEQT